MFSKNLLFLLSFLCHIALVFNYFVNAAIFYSKALHWIVDRYSKKIIILFYRIRHFPIEAVQNGVLLIGKLNFPNLMDIVDYYQKNPLFYSEHKEPIKLGNSFSKDRVEKKQWICASIAKDGDCWWYCCDDNIDNAN